MFPLISAALAQAAVSGPASSSIELGTSIVGLVCSNQVLVASVITFLAAHFGLSVASGILKKAGATKNSPVIGAFIPLIRLLAIDTTPPPQVVVASATAIVNQPVVSAPVTAAIDTLSTAMKTPPETKPAS
jgi:hypothetical protein